MYFRRDFFQIGPVHGDPRGIVTLPGARVLQRIGYEQRLVVPADFAVLQQGVVVERAIQYHDYDSDETPPAPRITAPVGVKATFTEWRQLRRRQPSQSRSARWFGRLQIEQVAEILTPNAALLVSVGDDQEVKVPLFAKASAPRQGSGVGSAATRPQEK